MSWSAKRESLVRSSGTISNSLLQIEVEQIPPRGSLLTCSGRPHFPLYHSHLSQQIALHTGATTARDCNELSCSKKWPRMIEGFGCLRCCWHFTRIRFWWNSRDGWSDLRLPCGCSKYCCDKWEWYKGKCGLPEHVNSEPRGGICSTSICSNELLIVPDDLTKDSRFADQDIVKGAPHFRFYAGLHWLILRALHLVLYVSWITSHVKLTPRWQRRFVSYQIRLLPNLNCDGVWLIWITFVVLWPNKNKSLMNCYVMSCQFDR